jgi:hypothetical protein
MVRRAFAVVGGLLVMFHVWLLGSQLWEGHLAEPDPSGQTAPALPETVTAVLQIAAASVIAGLGLALLAALVGSVILRPPAGYRPVLVRRRVTPGLEHSSRFAPRPPPDRLFMRS